MLKAAHKAVSSTVVERTIILIEPDQNDRESALSYNNISHYEVLESQY